MNTDDLLCVGAVDNILVSSTIGRNKMLIPGEVISAIINGTDIVPVNFAWAVMLAEMIRETNHYDGREISDAEIQHILAKTTESVKKILPVLSKKQIKADIQTIYTTIQQIAYREEVTTDVNFMSIGEYTRLLCRRRTAWT